MRLDAITFDTVERYIAGKLAGTVYDKGVPVGEDDPLSARSINMTVMLLGAILERAQERGLIDYNAAIVANGGQRGEIEGQTVPIESNGNPATAAY